MAASVLVLAVSCSTMPKDFEAPRVTITDLTPKDMAIFEQRFDVKLRIQNPNDQELSINGLRFDIQLNEHEFASGMSGQHVAVPRFGSRWWTSKSSRHWRAFSARFEISLSERDNTSAIGSKGRHLWTLPAHSRRRSMNRVRLTLILNPFLRRPHPRVPRASKRK